MIYGLGADTEVAAQDEALAHQVSATRLAARIAPPKQMAAAPAASGGRRCARPNPTCWRHSGRARRAAGRQGRPPRPAAGDDHLPMRRTASRPIERGRRQQLLAGALATSISAHRARRAAGGYYLGPQRAATTCWCAGGVQLGASSAAASFAASGWWPAVTTSARNGPRPPAGAAGGLQGSPCRTAHRRGPRRPDKLHDL